MHTKTEIKEKLEQAEKARENATGPKTWQLDGVIDTLRWVLGIKITQEPKDPVSED